MMPTRFTRLRWFFTRMRARLRRPVNRQAGVALLVVTVTIAVMGAAIGEFAYNARVDLEAASNSRDMLKAEYLARSSMQLGRLLIAVQGGLSKQLQAAPGPLKDFLGDFAITDYADFLAKAFGGDAEARAGLGGLVGLDLANVEGLGAGKGATLDLDISAEEGKIFLNCGDALNPDQTKRQQLFRLIDAMIRPPRFSRMFNVVDRDNVLITYEDVPRAILDWVDVDQLRFEPLGGATASEERYDRGRDRYEAHNHNMDTVEELNLVRGVGEDFWANFGEMFTVYGGKECGIMARSISEDAWPLVAAMLAAASPDPATVFDPNTTLVAQQVASILKTALPLLRKPPMPLEPCKPDPRCTPGQNNRQPPPPPQGQKNPPKPQASTNPVTNLASIVCSPSINQALQAAQSMTSLLGGAPPPTNTGFGTLRPIPLCPNMLEKYLLDSGTGQARPRRFFRVNAKGTIQRNETKSTQVQIRGVWDDQAFINNTYCTGHTSCTRGTWVYFRMD